MWKLNNGFLGTDDVLKQMGFHLASQCGGKNREDNMDHILLYCGQASYLWQENAHLLYDTSPLSSFNTISDCLHFLWIGENVLILFLSLFHLLFVGFFGKIVTLILMVLVTLSF